MKSVRCSYVVIGALTLVFALGYFLQSDVASRTANICLGLGCNLAILLIGLVLVNRVLEQQALERERRSAMICFRRLSRPLVQHLNFWTMVWKAGADTEPPLVPLVWDQSVVQGIKDSLHYFQGQMPAPAFPACTWNTYLVAQMQGFKQDLEGAIDKYAHVLSPDQLESIEKVIGSNFMKIGPELALHSNAQFTFIVINQIENRSFILPDLLNYIDLLTLLVSMHNGVVGRGDVNFLSANTWAPTVAPRLGQFRMHP